MTQEQQKVLEQFDNSTIYHFLREIRNIAFISWGIDDVIGQASEQGFVMNEDKAIDIIAEIDRRSDASLGITWDTIDHYIDTWIEDNSFEVEIFQIDTGEQLIVKFCALTSNENIENFHSDDDYYMYGYSIQEVEAKVGQEIGSDKILKLV